MRINHAHPSPHRLVSAGRDPKDYLLELIGPARRIDPRTLSDSWNYSEPPDRYPFGGLRCFAGRRGRARRIADRASAV